MKLLSTWAPAGIAAGLMCCASGISPAQVNVTTFHNDAARTGQNIQETILTPANVNSTQFGKLFSVSVDGVVYAQPLYLSAVNIAGGTHDVVYVATEHDSVYAIDANTGAVYAHVSLIPSGGSTVNSNTDLSCGDVVPEVGITGTPVIDAATGTLYVIAASKVAGKFYQYLHALDATTLSEKFNGPVAIQASVPGSGYDSSGGQVVFNPLPEFQRTALLLESGHVVMGWSAHCDHGPWHGWVMSYNAATLAQEGVFNTSPTLGESGVWISGGGIAADTSGNLYFPTGNGGWNGTTDFGDSIVKLGPPANGSFPVLDYFTPYNQGALYSGDVDVASGGLVLPPPLGGQQLIAMQDKQGTIYVLKAASLGKYCPNLTPACTTSDTNVVKEIVGASPGVWGSPAYWNGSLYWAGANDSIKAYSFNVNNTGFISTSPTSQSAEIFAFAAPTPIISSNGNTNGILWAIDGSADDSTCDGGGSNCLGLFAYDATNLARLLYTSSQAPNSRDSAGVAVKYQVPIVANGKVYVGTQSALVGYGLLSAVASTPTFSPAAGTYTAPQQVTLSDATPGALIYYTTNGTTPSTSSAQYVAGKPLTVSATETIEAIAVASGYANSAVGSGAYTISASGTSPVSVSLSAADDVVAMGVVGAAVSNGGLDGGGNAYAASLLGTSITWSGSTFALGGTDAVDAASSATIALPAGSYSSVALLATAVNGNQPNQKFVVTYTDGTTTSITQSLSDWFTPQNYTGESIVSTMAYRISTSGATSNGPFYLYGYTLAINSAKTVASITLPPNRNVVVLAIDLAGSASLPVAATPTLSPAPGKYTASQQVTLSDTTTGAVIHYTTNGTTPSASSAQYVAGKPLTISATETIEAIAVASGYANSGVASGTYTISTSGAAPVSVSLSSKDNVIGIGNAGTAVSGGGLDGGGNAYAASLLGASITWSGSTFALGGADAVDAASSATITLPAGNYSGVTLLATAVNGNQPNQKFVVTYTDGTTTSITQSVSDWFTPQNYAGESIVSTMAYRISTSGATDANGPFHLYGYALAINSAKIVASITLPPNRNVAVLAIDLAGGSSPPAATTSVSLSSKDNVVGIGNAGAAVSSGGLDGDGNAYASSLLGTSITWSGSTFALGGADSVDAASSATITLPTGNYSSVALLATAVNGNQPNQKFVVTYTDGTTTSITQSVSDWFTPQNYAGESIVSTMAYRISTSGATDANGPFRLYGYTLAINSAKTVASMTLPADRDVVVFAIDLVN